jgi:hypothetical protein
MDEDGPARRPAPAPASRRRGSSVEEAGGSSGTRPGWAGQAGKTPWDPRAKPAPLDASVWPCPRRFACLPSGPHSGWGCRQRGMALRFVSHLDRGSMTTLVTRPAFLSWCRQRGIGLDRRYSKPRGIVFLGPHSGKVWPLPPNRRQWPSSIGRTLQAMEARSFFRVSCRCPYWYAGEDWGRGEVDAFLARLGVPREFCGAIQFPVSRTRELGALLLLSLRAGWTQWDDIFVLPDHRQLVAWVCHHDEIHVDGPSREVIEVFAGRMARHRSMASRG